MNCFFSILELTAHHITIPQAEKTGDAIDDVTKFKLMISGKGCFSVIRTVFSENLMHGDMHAGAVKLVTMGCALHNKLSLLHLCALNFTMYRPFHVF
jgi:predicted unusual protein kinase regulating ubiquinone biosynthesis (AarF/ABC1/UbiB family)